LLREIFQTVLGAVAGLLGMALTMRVYLAWMRLSRNNPLAIFSIALTDWLVAPLRRVLPLRGRLDGAALFGALLVAMAFVFLLDFVVYSGVANWYLFLPSVLLHMIRWVLYLIFLLVVVDSLLSLVNPHAPLAPTFALLTRPLLAPLRRFIPPIGGFDLSPWALLILVLIGLTILDDLNRL